MKIVGAVLAAVLMTLMTPILVIIMIVGGGAGAAPESVAAACATDTNIDPVLATIRHLESRNDYTAEAAGASASGAYQFVDGTWDNFGGYGHAADAPPAVQDQKAAEMVRTVLADNNNDVTLVPVAWYLGHVPEPDSSEWNTVPMPEAGNTLTPREYQKAWMEVYNSQHRGASTGGRCVTSSAVTKFGDLPDVLDCGEFSWGGYLNGQIPESAMRYRDHSGPLHPAASEAFDRLYAAAQKEGLDLSGWGYRPASAGGNTAGTSCHGLGLAVDITSLTDEDTDSEFASPEFTWLCANAERYGWITPRWSIPEGKRCGTVTGTGTGGNIGDACCFLEPWHIEAAGIVTTHPDFK